jgi:Nitroreductase
VDRIRKGIEVARWAPNHHLTEPWHFYLPGPETIRSILQLNFDIVKRKRGETAAMEKQKRWARVPGWLVLTCDRSEEPVRAQEDYAACCCAAQNLMLYLWQRGIGTKWNTGALICDQQFYELLQINPGAEKVVGLFWYGYPEEIPVVKRKPLHQILTELP